MYDLKSVLGRQTFEEASYKVYVKETQYPYLRRIFIPHQPYKKLKIGMESSAEVLQSNGSDKNDNLDRSIRRTKSAVYDLTQCNQFELFVTFTFKADRQNINKCKSKMANWLKNQQKRNGKFEYLIIPEFHKDKKSLHFHALFKGYTGKIVKAKNTKRIKYNLKSYTLGFNDVRKIKQTPDDFNRVASYIRKYITKDMPILFGKNRYWASNTLKRPIVIENPPKWYEGKKPDWSYVSEYGTTLIFNTGVSDVK